MSSPAWKTAGYPACYGLSFAAGYNPLIEAINERYAFRAAVRGGTFTPHDKFEDGLPIVYLSYDHQWDTYGKLEHDFYNLFVNFTQIFLISINPEKKMAQTPEGSLLLRTIDTLRQRGQPFFNAELLRCYYDAINMCLYPPRTSNSNHHDYTLNYQYR